MCLNSYSFINEQPFSNSISILNFLPIFIFLKCFCRYLKMWKIANLGYGNERNSKTIYPIYMIFGRHMQKTNIYKTIKSFFWFCLLPWQPDWNNNHFQKVRVIGFMVYHPCGLAFRKVLKFDVENWAVEHWTPPLKVETEYKMLPFHGRPIDNYYIYHLPHFVST